MSFGQEAIEQLYRELSGGRQLSAKLHALLGRPLDSRGQHEAMAVSRELERVFMVSLYMLKPENNSRSVEQVISSTAPEAIRSGCNSNSLHTPTKDKCISREEATPFRKVGDEEVTRKEITPSPHKDGYQWRKYGQKNIQKSKFARYYYRCALSRGRRCEAKKQVQKQDDELFNVTYVNEHTCQLQQSVPDVVGVVDNNIDASARRRLSPEVQLEYSARNTSLFGQLSPHSTVGSVDEEDVAIVTCLAAVISGTADARRPAGVPEPEAFVPSADDDVGSMLADEVAMDFSYNPSTTCSPVEAPGDELIGYGAVPEDDGDAGRFFMDTVWPYG